MPKIAKNSFFTFDHGKTNLSVIYLRLASRQRKEFAPFTGFEINYVLLYWHFLLVSRECRISIKHHCLLIILLIQYKSFTKAVSSEMHKRFKNTLNRHLLPIYHNIVLCIYIEWTPKRSCQNISRRCIKLYSILTLIIFHLFLYWTYITIINTKLN